MRISTILLSAICTIATISCSNDSEISFSATTSDKSSTITIDRTGGEVEINVKSSYGWSVTTNGVDENELDWLMAATESGNKSGTAVIYVDPNYTGISRIGTIVIECESGESAEFSLIQTELFNGEPLENSSNINSGCWDAAITKGLGTGFDITKSTYKRKAIFNTKLIKNNIDLFDFYPYVENDIKQEGVTVMDQDSVMNKQDTIGVSLSIDVSYGKFTLNITGGYVSDEKVSEWNKEYIQKFSQPTGEAYYETADLVSTYYDTLVDNTVRKSIFSSGFTSAANKLYSALKGAGEDFDTYDTEKDLENSSVIRALENIDDSFGAAFVSYAKLGGEVMLKLQADSTMVSEVLQVTGSVTAAIKCVVTITANATVEYKNAGVTVWNNSNRSFFISGGTTSLQSAVIKDLQSISDIDIENEAIATSIENWANTVTNDNADVLEVELSPIWELFDDFRTQDVVRAYMEKTYDADSVDTVINISNFTGWN